MSEQLKLRAFEKEDLEFMHKLYNIPEVMRFWFAEPYQTMAKIKDSFEKNLEKENLRLFILEKNKERVGLVGLVRIDNLHRKAEFAIMIDPDHQGHGYAAKATQLAVDYAFTHLNLHKLFLVVDKQNEKAIYIYQKVGFQREAELKEEYFVDGAYRDVVYMCIFARDYWATQR